MNNSSAGRKKKWSTPEELQKDIDSYFDVVEKDKDPMTIEGLCVHLKCSRKSLCDYERALGYEPYHDVVSMAKMRICADLVKSGLKGKYNTGMAIFILKNNFGYSDNQKEETEKKKTKFSFGKK